MLALHLTIAGKKRLELARALAAQPKLLLLDEVLAGLNPTEVEHMIGVIRRIRDRGVTILIIEHLMQAIMSLSDRIVVLNFGQKLAEGLPAEVAQRSAGHRGLSRRSEARRRTARASAVHGRDASLDRRRSLEAGYGEVQVLWGVSLKARRGQLTAIVGANGAGKTTTLRAVAGTHRRRGAAASLSRGEDVTRLPTHSKAARGFALVPEGRQLFIVMTVAENLELGAFSKRAARNYADRLDKVFTLFPRLAERQRQLAGTLSGGEQQMVAIARGLMSDPDILIIDELSLGLAPVVVYQLFATLKQLKEAGLTILLVEQNVHLALALVRLRLCHRRGPPLHRRRARGARRQAGNPQGVSGAVSQWPGWSESKFETSRAALPAPATRKKSRKPSSPD